MTGVFCATSVGMRCVPVIIETCFSAFNFLLTCLTYSIEDSGIFLYSQE